MAISAARFAMMRAGWKPDDVKRHVDLAELLHGAVLVVAEASEAEVVERARSAPSYRNDMIVSIDTKRMLGKLVIN